MIYEHVEHPVDKKRVIVIRVERENIDRMSTNKTTDAMKDISSILANKTIDDKKIEHLAMTIQTSLKSGNIKSLQLLTAKKHKLLEAELNTTSWPSVDNGFHIFSEHEANEIKLAPVKDHDIDMENETRYPLDKPGPDFTDELKKLLAPLKTK